MASQITLFDLAKRSPQKGWSLNPWKTRLLLNFKGLDYKTEWLEYPNIKIRLQPHFADQKPKYTIPTIMLPTGEYIMDSRIIADRIEELHPTPLMHLDSEHLPKLEDIIRETQTALRAITSHVVPERILNEASIPYWNETRSKSAGMPLDEFYAKRGGPEAWVNAKPHLEEVTKMLKENEGPFFMGPTLSYTDFVWTGVLLFWRSFGDDLFQKFLDTTGDRKVHEKLLEAVQPWTARDDH